MIAARLFGSLARSSLSRSSYLRATTSLKPRSSPLRNSQSLTLRLVGSNEFELGRRYSANRAGAGGGFTFPGPRKLKDVAKLPLLEKRGPSEVDKLWREYHKDHKSAVGDVLSAETYDMLLHRTKRCPFFVLPVFRDSGYFTIILQWQDRHCLLTFLESYRRDPTSAEPYMTLTIFEELVASKGIALVRGEFTNRLSRREAEYLLENIKRFYLEEERNFKTVVSFNEKGENFDFDAVLRAVKRIGPEKA